jgi:1,4-alpha-glucan branching enzyme
MAAKKSATKATTKSAAPAKVAKKVAAPKPVATKSVTKTAAKKPVSEPARKAAAKKTVPAKEAPAKVKSPTAVASIEVKFERYSPASSTVDLVGSFNGWKVGQNPLKRGKDGTWSVKLKLAPGTYEYKFVYDGEFYEPDPEREQVPGPFGANNLLVVA